MNLANKYRPHKFEDMMEQSVVVEMIKSLCNLEELDNRNFLFIGSQGIGKTTIARIMADTLNDGKGEPIEIDAASHGSIDSVRDIVDQARKYSFWLHILPNHCGKSLWHPMLRHKSQIRW